MNYNSYGYNPQFNSQPLYQQPQQPNYNAFQQPMMQAQPSNVKYTLYAEVNGLEDAKAYILAPKQSAYLEDRNANMLYFKRANDQGRYEMDVYQKVVQQEPKSEYVKTSDFETLRASVDNLTEIIKKLENRQFSGSKQQNNQRSNN